MIICIRAIPFLGSLQNYITNLREDARKTKNEIDLIHCNFLIQIRELLEHNEFLTTQSQQVREFYKYMTKEYPYLAFTVKGRIKSLIRAEEKFNGYIVKYISDYYEEYGKYPTTAELKRSLRLLSRLDRIPDRNFHAEMPL